MGEDPLALAIGALRRRERSRAELEAWLLQRGVDEREASATVARLEELGELDDGRFARRYAEDKRELRGWGPERIHEALRARSVDEEQIAAALAEAGPEEEVNRAAHLLARRGEALDCDAARARALAYLTRRGYPYEIAYEAVRARGRAA